MSDEELEFSDDEDLDLSTRAGRQVLGKRSANSQLRTLDSKKKGKRESAAAKISPPIADMAEVMRGQLELMMKEIDSREPAWKRALVLLQNDYCYHFSYLSGFIIRNLTDSLMRDGITGNSSSWVDKYISFVDLLLVTNGK